MQNQPLKRLMCGSTGLALGLVGGFAYGRFRQDMSRAYRRVALGGKRLTTPYGPLEYADRGDGPPVLMVHGAGGGYDQGLIFAGLIGGRFRWIAPSRFGFLGTPVPPGADSVVQADAYAALLDALGIERVAVVGASMGGPSALLFAARYPERTISLVMISAVSHAILPRPPVLAAVFNLFLYDFIFWMLLRLTPNQLLAALGVPMEVQAQLSSQDVERFRAFLTSIQPMGARRAGQLLE